MLISYFLHFTVAPLRVNRCYLSVLGAYVLSIVEQSSSDRVKRNRNRRTTIILIELAESGFDVSGKFDAISSKANMFC